MTLQALLPDIILLLVLAAFTIAGALRGSLRTLAGLLSLIVSLAGAKLLADHFSAQAAQWLIPKLEPVIAQKLTDSVSSAASSDPDGGLGGILSILPGAQSVLSTAADAAASSITRAVAQTLGWALVFLLAFLVLRLLCWLITRVLYGLDRLPGLHFANHLLGAVLGLIKGGVVLVLAVMVLRGTGVMTAETMQNSYLLHFFGTLGSVH